MREFGVLLGYLGLVFNVVGGVATLAGVGFIVFGAGSELVAGWGDARTLGYLFFCVGLCFVAAGLVLARYVRSE